MVVSGDEKFSGLYTPVVSTSWQTRLRRSRRRWRRIKNQGSVSSTDAIIDK